MDYHFIFKVIKINFGLDWYGWAAWKSVPLVLLMIMWNLSRREVKTLSVITYLDTLSTTANTQQRVMNTDWDYVMCIKQRGRSSSIPLLFQSGLKWSRIILCFKWQWSLIDSSTQTPKNSTLTENNMEVAKVLATTESFGSGVVGGSANYACSQQKLTSQQHVLVVECTYISSKSNIAIFPFLSHHPLRSALVFQELHFLVVRWWLWLWNVSNEIPTTSNIQR